MYNVFGGGFIGMGSNNIDKEIFEIMINDWIGDNKEAAEGLKISEPYFDDELGWIADAEDNKMVYTLIDDGFGNIVLKYSGTK